LLLAFRRRTARRTDLSRSFGQRAHHRMGIGGRRASGRRLPPARPRPPPVRVGVADGLHREAVLLGPAKSGYAAAHPELHCARSAAGGGELDLHPLSRSSAQPARTVAMRISTMLLAALCLPLFAADTPDLLDAAKKGQVKEAEVLLAG